MRTNGTPERVRLLATDVDGVLTDGRIYLSADGGEMKAFHVRDGAGIKYAQRAGLTVAFITGRSSPLVDRRAAELGVTEVHQGAIDKRVPFRAMIEAGGVAREEICYVGDDLLDLPILRSVGFAVAVADAHPDVIDASHHVTDAPGGGGALREVVELILKRQGLWEDITARYGEPA